MTARLELEYDGSGFAGWARQPGLRSVQEELESALEQVRGERTPVVVAGRTDAGVHARGQVASHAGDPAPATALNGVLPPYVGVLASEPAPDGFDARADARSRVYRYRVWTRAVASPFERGRSLHWPHAVDRAALEETAALVVGRHDFTAFTPTQTDHVRFERDIVRSEWLPDGDHALEYWIEADTFMRHMVRILVGTMLAASRGRLSADEFARLLDGRPRTDAAETARPCGLYLEAVRY